jgi:dihydroorotase
MVKSILRANKTSEVFSTLSTHMKTFLLLACAIPCMAQAQYDLLLKGGHVIDPKNNIDARMDVAVRGGAIAAVAPSIDATQARRTLDVSGLYVTPGLIDLHTHVFHTTGVQDAWAGDNSIPPDTLSFRTGVTTFADAGSSGWRNFETFRHTVIERAKTRVLAFINIAGLGMMTDIVEQTDFNPKEVARLAMKHKDVVVGVKSAHYQLPDWKSVDSAIEAGNAANIPIMVDFGYFLPQRPYWQLVTERLRPGDISTHMFRGPVPWVDDSGKLLPYLQRARARGVKFDVGHGGGSFVLRNAVPAVKQGFYPDSISTDLHTGSMNAQMQDMPTTMSKFLAMGMPLKEVVRASTWTPAQLIKRAELGHLTVGAPADVAVWNLMSGKFGYADAAGGRVGGTQRLLCELTLRDGRIAWDYNARGALGDFHKLSPTYGIRPGIDQIIRPPK